MKSLSKEYQVNKIAAALVPNLGHFSEIPAKTALIKEKYKMTEMALNSDTLDDSTRKNLKAEFDMLSQALKWMKAKVEEE